LSIYSDRGEGGGGRKKDNSKKKPHEYFAAWIASATEHIFGCKYKALLQKIFLWIEQKRKKRKNFFPNISLPASRLPPSTYSDVNVALFCGTKKSKKEKEKRPPEYFAAWVACTIEQISGPVHTHQNRGKPITEITDDQQPVQFVHQTVCVCVCQRERESVCERERVYVYV